MCSLLLLGLKCLSLFGIQTNIIFVLCFHELAQKVSATVKKWASLLDVTINSVSLPKN